MPKEEQTNVYDDLMAAVEKKIEDWKVLLQVNYNILYQKLFSLSSLLNSLYPGACFWNFFTKISLIRINRFVLQSKDKELTESKQKIQKLQQEISEYNIDTDRASVSALTKVIVFY